MANYPRSVDGAWYWDGRRWVSAGDASTVPLPSFLGRRGGSHWDRGELFVRSVRAPMVVATVLLGVVVALDLGTLVLLAGLAGGAGRGSFPAAIAPLSLIEVGDVLLLGCWIYFLRWSVRPPSIRFSGRGILARQPWRGSFYVPWEAVVQIGTHRGPRLLLTVEVSEEFWRFLGRRWTPTWVAPFSFGGPPHRPRMIAIPPRGTGMDMADILRCVRQLAPARIPVDDGPATPA